MWQHILFLCDENSNQYTHTYLCVASKVLSYHATAPLEEANKLKVCNHKINVLENSWVDC